MRALPLLALLVLTSTSALAVTRGSGTKITAVRKIADFTAIHVEDGVTLEVKQGPTSLSIEGDDNIVPLYTTEVVSGTLRIERKSKEFLSKRNDLIIRVTTPSLSRLEANGGVEVLLLNGVAKKFSAALSGGVDLKANSLALETLELEGSGGVHLAMAGKAHSAKFKLSGGVELKAKDLAIDQLVVDASGGCDLDLNVKESIIGDISGGVGVKVRGNPPRSRVHTGGGADVDYVD